MITNNIGFYEDLTKVIFRLLSNMHIISSSESIPWLSIQEDEGQVSTEKNHTGSYCVCTAG